MNHREVQKLIGTIHQLWPTVPFQTEVNADMVEAWQIVLSDVPVTTAAAILAHHARQGAQYPPTPGQLAHECNGARDRAQGISAPTADEAWAEVRAAISRYGYYTGPPSKWSNPAVASCVDALGWKELCHGDEMVVRAHFMKLYPDAAKRVEASRALTSTLTALNANGAARAIEPGDTPTL